MAFGVADDLLVAIVPSIVYWIYSGMYAMLGDMDDYRLHPIEDVDTKNIVSKREVVKGVLIQQALQIGVSVAMFMFIGVGSEQTRLQPSFFVIICQLLIAAVTLDTHQYFMHRLMHTNKFLTKIHSGHHALVVPYPYGALYAHPLDGFILEIAGCALASLVSGMTPQTSLFFFTFATIKTVDDHCGLVLPWNLIQRVFSNNCAYHDVHHQLYGNKYNFSQPFFITWDKILGTHMPFSIEGRKRGGFEVIPNIKKD